MFRTWKSETKVLLTKDLSVVLLFYPLLMTHYYCYLSNGIDRHILRVYIHGISRDQRWQLQKHCIPITYGKGVPRSLRLTCSKQTTSVLLVCHAFPLSLSLSKDGEEVLDPCLEYSLRKLPGLMFLPGKEAFPYSSHYKKLLVVSSKKVVSCMSVFTQLTITDSSGFLRLEWSIYLR